MIAKKLLINSASMYS